MKRHSTGSLTKEQKAKQDKIYSQHNAYDYLIMGTGMSALAVGALLANAGKKICMVEAHDHPGGMAHSFTMGDYTFCAQVHYIWGCAPGGRIYEFLKHIGLEKDITFELLGPEGYDRMVMPDGKKVMIPYGFDKLVENINQAYPGEKKNLEKFINVLEKIRSELRNFPEKMNLLDIATKWWKFTNLIKYRTRTLQDVFDECNLSKEAQAVLSANAGDFMAPPKDLSIFCYTGLFGGYNTGAYYPTKHFNHFIGRLAEFITDHEGCHIFYETRVTKIEIEDGLVKKIIAGEKEFTAKSYICNMDPQQTSYLIGRDKFPKKYLPKLDYTYSPSGMMIYLGLKEIDLKKYDFGRFNTWHLEQWSMNDMWDEQGKHKFTKPWVFISTPTMHTNYLGTAPKGGHIMEIATYTEYEPFKKLQKKNYRDYAKAKQELAERLIDLVEEKYIPELRKHIAVKIVGTPTTHEDFCMAPKGNAYGSYLNPKQIGLGRLKADTPFKNLWWCNASSGFGGIHGTISTSMDLYMNLTGDRFYNIPPADEEFISWIRGK